MLPKKIVFGCESLARNNRAMTKIAWIPFGVLLASGIGVSAGSAPEAEIANGSIRVRLYLPDADTGFYRGTRFDWSGVVGSLEYAGHNYYPPWFQRRSEERRVGK